MQRCTRNHALPSPAAALGCRTHTRPRSPTVQTVPAPSRARQQWSPAGQALLVPGGQQRRRCVVGSSADAARRVVWHRAAALEEIQTAAAPAVPPADGGVFIEDVRFEHGSYTVRGRLETAAPPELVYSALTDYTSLSRVFHNVLDSQVLMVGQEKQLVQTCKWAFLIFSGTFRTSLAVSEEPAARRLAFHLVQSSFMRQFVGRWEVVPAPGAGSDGGGEGSWAVSVKNGKNGRPARSLVMHSLSVAPAVAPPAAVAHYTSKIFVKQVENILKDLQVELHRRLDQEQQQQQHF